MASSPWTEQQENQGVRKRFVVILQSLHASVQHAFKHAWSILITWGKMYNDFWFHIPSVNRPDPSCLGRLSIFDPFPRPKYKDRSWGSAPQTTEQVKQLRRTEGAAWWQGPENQQTHGYPWRMRKHHGFDPWFDPCFDPSNLERSDPTEAEKWTNKAGSQGQTKPMAQNCAKAPAKPFGSFWSSDSSAMHHTFRST